MPRHIPERKKPILDKYVKASVDQVNGKHDRYTGHYATLTWNLDTSDYRKAVELRNALYRSARHLDVGLDLELDQQPNGSYRITYTAVHPRYKDDYWSPLEVHKRQLRDKRA